MDDRNFIAGEFVGAQELADFHVNQFDQFGIVNLVGLVHEDDDGGDADLAGEQDVLAGLGHRAVRGGDEEDGTVHLGSAGDHVLNIVGVSGAVDVRVVALFGLVFDVGGVDGDTAFLFFRSVVDFIVLLHITAIALGLAHGDSGGQSGFAVVNVADGADVDMGFRPLECFFCHGVYPSFFCLAARPWQAPSASSVIMY